MKEQPLLSIIVPVYNVEKYLAKCLDSIIDQTYSNLEIIVVNDGSKDKSKLICNDYALKDKRINVIHKENGGLSSARNTGLEIATGKYIGFVDSDDWIDSDMYETLLSSATKFNSDIVECNVRYVYKNKIEENVSGETIVCDNKAALSYFLSDYKYFKPMVCNKIFHRNIFKSLRFKEGYIHEDGFFTYKALYKAEKVVYTAVAKYNYLQNRDGSIMDAKFSMSRLVILEAFKERTLFFEENGDNKLANKSMDEYLRTLLTFYVKAKEIEIAEKDKGLGTVLQSEILSNYKKVIDGPFSSMLKLRFYLFKINPYLYIYCFKTIITIRKKLKKK
ncbi:glycosyltransferase [Metabacillus sp. FJAT-52054]|uniref:Glycosyltransferase n=1 Tax=Metabacillus sediminis TaxID=3117746 RepID=A0ABZ2NG19_9BACI